MVIISQRIIYDFANRYPLAAYHLNRWYKLVLAADWDSIASVRNVFNNVDFVGNDRYVFDIAGNKYRLVAMIHFSTRTVYIRFIGTHSQYDEICKAGRINSI